MSAVTRLPPDACCGCGAVINGHTGAGHGREPRVGDVSLCLYCGAANQYGPDFRLRPFDEGLLDEDQAVELAMIRAEMATLPTWRRRP